MNGRNWTQCLIFSACLIVSRGPLFATTPMETCGQALHDPSIQKFLSIQELLDSEKKAAQIGIDYVREDLELIQNSPVPNIQNQITRFRRAKLALKPLLILGTLGQKPQAELLKPMIQLYHGFDARFNELNQYDQTIQRRLDRLHTLIEDNVALVSRFTEELERFKKQKGELESLINMNAREKTVLNFANLKVFELEQSVLNLRNRMISLENFKKKLNQQARELSLARSQLVTIRNSEIPDLMTNLPARIALEITRKPVAATLPPPEASIKNSRFRFGDQWLEPKKIIDFLIKNDPATKAFYYTLGSSDFKLLVQNKLSREILLDYSWNYLLKVWKELRYDKERTLSSVFLITRYTPITYQGVPFLSIDSLDQKTLRIVDIDQKNKKLLVFDKWATQLKVVPFSEYSLYPFRTENALFGVVENQKIKLEWIGFDNNKQMLYRDKSNPNKTYSESRVRILDPDGKTSNLKYYSLSLKDQLLHTMNSIGMDVLGNPIYMVMNGTQELAGTIEELKTLENDTFEILTPPNPSEQPASDKLHESKTPSQLILAGTRANGDKIYHSDFYKQASGVPALTAADFPSFTVVNHPNALSISEGSIVGAIDIHSFWGQQLKAILTRLAKGVPQPSFSESIDLGYEYGRIQHPYQTHDGLSAITIPLRDGPIKAHPLFAMFGQFESYSNSVFTLIRSDEAASQTSYGVSLEKYLVMDVTKGKSTLTNRFTIGDEILNEDQSTSRILASFAIQGIPYILKYRYRVRPHYLNKDNTVESMYKLEIAREDN